MDTAMWRTWALIAVLLVGLLPATTAGAPAECPIAEGAGIGGVTIGQGAVAALAVTGPPLRQQTVGSQVVYTLRPPWSQMITDYGIVQRVATRAAQCRTPKGIGLGSTLVAVRDAYAGANVSSLTPVQDGTLLSYPFIGVAFWLRDDRVEAVEIFRAEGTRAARPAAPVAQTTPTGAATRGASPSPTPTTAAGTWSVRSTSVRVESGAVVISGVVENRSAARSAYAEARAFSGTGGEIGQGDAPLQPNPVPSGGSATFEVRLAVTGIPRRYTVTIRPAGRSNEVLARATGELKDKDLQQFGSVVAQQLQVTVQSTAATPNPNGFVVLVTNGSSLPVANVNIDVELSITCRVPLPVLHTIQEMWRASVTVQQIPAGGTSRAALQLSGGVCLEFTSWTPTTRIGEVKIAE